MRRYNLESARHSSLSELKQVQHLVAEAHREMERLKGERAEMVGTEERFKREAATGREAVEEEAAGHRRGAARAQAEAEAARDQLAAVCAERDKVGRCRLTL